MENLIIAAISVLGLAVGPVVHAVDSGGGTPAQTASAPSAADAKAYIDKAAMADMFEVRSSRLALAKSQDPGLRSFAQRMVDDHGMSTRTLKDTLISANIDVTPPASLDQAHRQKLARLLDAAGDRFDRAYREIEIAGHQEALKLHRDYDRNGGNPALRQFAKEAAATVQQHLDEIEALNQAGTQAGAR